MWILFGCSSVVICVVTCCVLIFGILCSFGALRQYWNRRTWPLTQQIMPPPSHKNWNVCSCVCIMRNCADSLETGKLQYPTVAPLISFYNRVQRIIQTNRPYIYIYHYIPISNCHIGRNCHIWRICHIGWNCHIERPNISATEELLKLPDVGLKMVDLSADI